MGFSKPYFSNMPSRSIHLPSQNAQINQSINNTSSKPATPGQTSGQLNILPVKISPFPDLGIKKSKKEPTFTLNKKSNNINLLDLSASSYFVKELSTQKIVLDKNSKDILPIGSITKLMTVMVVKDSLASSSKILITPEILAIPGESGFVENEVFTAQDLIKASLISSLNDAAFALAKESVKDFIFLMNAKADQIGMISTNFSDPTGLDDELNFSTAYDVGLLAEYIFNYYNDLAKISVTPSDKITSLNQKLTHSLYNTDALITASSSAEKILLSKTGTTEKAKECLVIVAEINHGKFLIVLLGSDDRVSDAQKIILWLSQSYEVITQ